MSLVSYFDQSFYPGVESYWDDRALRAFVLKDCAQATRCSMCGLEREHPARDGFSRTCGVDPDPRVETNPFLNEGRIGFGEKIPYADDTFDIAVADNVLEHLVQPEVVFTEIRRVLKPGGRFLFKTPNRRHYMPMIASATPHWFHNWFNERRGRRARTRFAPCIKRIQSKR